MKWTLARHAKSRRQLSIPEEGWRDRQRQISNEISLQSWRLLLVKLLIQELCLLTSASGANPAVARQHGHFDKI